MSKAAVQSYLCRPFCSFYRAGIKEEMACQGALVLAGLMQRRRLSPEDLPAPREKARRLWREKDEALERVLCQPCPFALDGCDFHSPLRCDTSEPCGGYLLLQLLTDAGTINCAELQMAPEGGAHVA